MSRENEPRSDGLDISAKSFDVYCQAGKVADVEVTPGGNIRGLWTFRGEERRLVLEDGLLEEFVNVVASATKIRLFTQKYGLLFDPPPKRQGHFEFTIAEWNQAQSDFRVAWTRVEPGSKIAPLPFAPTLDVLEGERFEFNDDEVLVYRAASLYRLMLFQLHLVRPDYRAICKRVGCPAPYFLSRDLKQAYCTSDCFDAARQEAKRDWWRTKGSKQRRITRRSRS